MQKIDNLIRGVIGEEWTNRILYQTYSIAGHEVTIPMIVLFVICVILFILIIKNLKAAFSGRGGRGGKKAVKYVEAMTQAMEEKKNLKLALEKLASEYTGSAKEKKVFQDALYYLSHSIARDYQGALTKIEEFYKSDEVEELHGRILGGEFND